MTNSDNVFLERCFQLALNGLGKVMPNPLVGCVIVKDGFIIGEGFHQIYGGNHAERNAIESVKDPSLLENATLYVNLEPCSHFGKTPPCCDLIINGKIKKVIFSNLDPNPLVAGQGLEKLRNSGIEVCPGILEKEGFELNKRFFTFFSNKRPYIILKWAQTRNGFMDIERPGISKYNWITNRQLTILSHKWRTEEAAIMVGSNTVKNDNPQLNVRLWKGNNPVRIVLDRLLQLDLSSHVFNGKSKTLVYTEKEKTSASRNLEFIKIDFSDMASEILRDLYQREIQSVIIEGGRKVLDTFLTQNLWDEIRLLIGNQYFDNGLEAPQLKTRPVEEIECRDNRILLFKNKMGNEIPEFSSPIL